MLMLTDRRPILLANARVVDPSRDFDGPGDVLIADGIIRETRRGIGAAGVPEGTDVINCAENPDVVEQLNELTGGRGPDAVIDAVGMEAAHGDGALHAVERAKQANRPQSFHYEFTPHPSGCHLNL